MHKNPYAQALGSRDPLKALSETPRKIKTLTAGWSGRTWNKSYAAGKWSARQILVHLAQTELALTTRVRYGADFYGSEDLLRSLTSKVLTPEFQVRFKWRPNSIVMWDNILTQHYAVMDYTESRRMVRATIKGRPLNG